MMYKIAVPICTIHAERSSKEALLERLRSLDSERVFLTLTTKGTPGAQRELSILKEYTAFLKDNGYEVGAWLWAFGVQGEHQHTEMRLVTGETVKNEVCPSDPEYCGWLEERVKAVAACGVDMIMLDDDFRFGFQRGGFGCLCPNHLDKISEILGESITPEFMKEKLLSGGGNRYRDAFLRANGFWLEEIARRLRQAVDTVNPRVRMGQCTCMTSWDIDGSSPERISRILAGETRPFYRLVGAPYWADCRHWGQRVQDVIELERMECGWRQDRDIEVFSEGDVYPRPRWQIPAAYLEGFDTAMRAANCTDGILKYALDYTSGVEYEQGYVRRHTENKPLYQQIEQHFAQKTVCGVRVYEAPQKYAAQEIYPSIAGTCAIQNSFFSPAAEMLACCAIPTVYEGDGICGIVFGENARSIPVGAPEHGLILDIEAVRILQQQGIDTGVAEFGDMVSAEEEFFPQENQYVAIPAPEGKVRYCCTKLRPGAEVQSTILTNEGEFPASYYYQNQKGQRFLVFTFEAYFASERLWRQYTRARQLAAAVERLSGRPMPARITADAPDLYMICKESEDSLSVGLWNFSMDPVPRQKIVLAETYTNAEFINCTGRLEDGEIVLSEMQPYAFAGFTVKKAPQES